MENLIMIFVIFFLEKINNRLKTLVKKDTVNTLTKQLKGLNSEMKLMEHYFNHVENEITFDKPSFLRGVHHSLQKQIDHYLKCFEQT